jgi:effector-binding domain-containing protein
MEFATKQVPAMDVACKSYQGPGSEIGRVFSEVFTWVRMRGLRFGGPLIAVYLDEPHVNPRSDVRAEVWVPFLGDPEIGSEMQTRYLPSHHVAYTIHRGNTNSINVTEEALFQWVESQGLRKQSPWYRRQVYLKRGDTRYPDIWETEVQVPILQ